MNRFLSNYINRLDAEGRVSIPAAFRMVLAKDGFDGLYLHLALDAPALDAGGNLLLNEIDQFLQTLAPYSEERDRLSTALFGTQRDPEARLRGEEWILTETVKDHAGITDAVAFVGLGHKFQIWEPARFRAHLAEAAGEGAGPEKGVRLVKPLAGAAGLRDAPTSAVLLEGGLRGARRRARRRLRRRHLRRRRLCGGLPRRRTREPRHRDRPRPGRRLPAGAALAETTTGRLVSGARPLRRRRRRSSRKHGSERRDGSSSTSASPPCSSTRPSAASRSAETARSTCAWSVTGEARPTSSTTAWKPSWPTSSFITARSGGPAPSRAPSSRSAGRRPSRPRAQLAELVAGPGPRRARRHASGDPRFPGAAHRRQR